MFFRKEENELKIHGSKSVKLCSPDSSEWMEVLSAAMEGLVCINIAQMKAMEKQSFADRMAGGMYASGGYFYQLTDDVYLLMPGSISFTELGKSDYEDVGLEEEEE